ncbi:hypothetical protein AB0B79_30335 [Streptomyces sp. NPDC039022]|uniref:hypothetical protein n=1 Tax=Streptomyces sp. NPDC039022 TaxID=3157091 RepID=UPI0033C9E96E
MGSMDITRELVGVSRLELDTRLSRDGGGRTREFLVRRAAVLDRLAEDDGGSPPADAAEKVVDAMEYAQALIEYDREHGTTRGAVPVTASCWEDDPGGYVRQEHAAWVQEHDVLGA